MIPPGAAVEKATKAQRKAASKAYERGMTELDKGNAEKALSLFSESYGAVASPNSHLMVVQTLVQLERWESAYVEVEVTVTEADEAAQGDAKYASTAEEARKVRTQILQHVGLLKIGIGEGVDGDLLRISGRELPTSDISRPVVVPAGPGEILVIDHAGQVVHRQSYQLAAGATTDVLLAKTSSPVSPPADESEGTNVAVDSSKFDRRTWAYVAGGVGAAGLVSFGVFGLMSNAAYSDLESGCSGTSCPSNLRGTRDDGSTYQTLANVSLGVGLVGLGVGAWLYLTSSPSERPPATESGTEVAVGPGSVYVNGRF